MPLLRLHLDENVDPDIADGLRAQGINVTTTQEVGLRTTEDNQQFEFAQREQRILVTHDRDFLRIAAKLQEHCGIIYCPVAVRSIGEIILESAAIAGRFTPEEMRGRVEYI
jgi:predicted nuclease of predicted toxin-antitoxin system